MGFRTLHARCPCFLLGLLVLCTGLSTSERWLAKTKETFKVADLKFLEARLESPRCKRLLLDAATGSSLIFFNHTLAEHHGSFVSLPWLQKCDWVGKVLAVARTAELLLADLQSYRWKQEFGAWTLDYTRMIPSTGENSRSPPLNYTQKTLLCAVAQSIPFPAALNAQEANDQLLLVETGYSLYLVSIMDAKSSPFTGSAIGEASIVAKRWSQRPFPFSSAMNFEAATIILDLLAYLCPHGPNQEFSTLLDPTCGSGTFLALAMERGMRVVGWDSNPVCIEGSRRNLENIFGEERVHRNCSLETRDSGLFRDDTCVAEVDCVVANLPWGINSIDYTRESERIVSAIRRNLSVGVPCAFVCKTESSVTSWVRLGYRVLGKAHIPQLNFRLPEHNKKGTEEKGPLDPRKHRGDCVVFVVESTKTISE